MAKYLYRDATTGRVTEKTGTVTSAGAGSSGEIVQLDGAGRLDATVMPVGFGDDVSTVTTAEVLTAGDFVAINASGLAVRASASSGGFDAAGFVLSGFSSGASATVYFEGTNTARTGLTAGTRYYLSDVTPGGVTSTPVVGTGKRHQTIGVAISTTAVSLEAGESILLA